MNKESSEDDARGRFAELDGRALDALAGLLALKKTKRTGWLRAGVDPAQCESVADHAFHVVLLAALFADESLDRAIVLEMAILHDLAETVVGDLTPSDCPREEKIACERKAMTELCRALPDGERRLGTWEAYERQVTPEARFVRAVDRCEMAWQAALYAREAGIDPTPFFASASREADASAFDALVQAMSGFLRRTSDSGDVRP